MSLLEEMVLWNTEKDTNPCEECGRECDGWDSRFCCELCEWLGGGDCESCDPMDI